MPSALPPRADSDQPPLVTAGTGQTPSIRHPVPGLFRLLSRAIYPGGARRRSAGVSKCPDLHCEGCGGGKTAAVLALTATLIAAVIAVAAELLIIIGTIVAVTFAVLGYAAVRSWRRGWRPSRRAGCRLCRSGAGVR